MYAKPTISRFGTFRDLTQLGCTGFSDLLVPGIGSTDGHVPEIVDIGGVKTTKVCFSAFSGM